MTHGFSRKSLKVVRDEKFPVEECHDEEVFENEDAGFPEEIGYKNATTVRDRGTGIQEVDLPEEDRVNLIGDTDRVSDASMAIKALLGEGGDFRAASEIDDNQIRALLVLLDVAEELNSPRLLRTAENFLLLSISGGGRGRQQVVGAFKGLYEPTDLQMKDGQMPSGQLRGVR